MPACSNRAIVTSAPVAADGDVGYELPAEEPRVDRLRHHAGLRAECHASISQTPFFFTYTIVKRSGTV